MQIFFSLSKVFILNSVVHREYWLGLFFRVILPLFVPLFAWLALFDYTKLSLINGWGKEDFIFYYLINFLILTLTESNFHKEFSELVLQGTLNYWLLKPFRFIYFAFASIASRIVLTFIPILFCILLLYIVFPHIFNLNQLVALLFMFPGALMISSAFSITLSMLAFWLIHTEGVFSAFFLIFQFLGGVILPLVFLPNWIQFLGSCLPLNYVFNLPVTISQDPNLVSIFYVIIGQIIWSLTLGVICFFLFKLGIRHYDAIGG